MISEREFEAIQVGDMVHIVDEWPDAEVYERDAIEYPDEHMDPFRDMTLPVVKVDGYYIMLEGTDDIPWFRYEIDCVNPACDEEPCAVSTNEDIMSLFS